jgi:hypothetical protein
MVMIHDLFSHLSDPAYASFVYQSYQDYLTYESDVYYTRTDTTYFGSFAKNYGRGVGINGGCIGVSR